MTVRWALALAAFAFAASAEAQTPLMALANAKTCADFMSITKTWPQSQAAATAKAKMAQMKCVDPEVEARRLAAEKAALEARLAAAEREAEQARRAAEQKDRELASERARREAAARTTPTTTAPKVFVKFDVDQLHPDVRQAALEARRTQQAAEAAAARGRTAAAEGRNWATKARSNATGTSVYTNGDYSYAGQFANGDRNGYGEGTFGPGDNSGNRHAGEFRAGAGLMLGVYENGDNVKNTAKILRHEGEMKNSAAEGLQKIFWMNGSIYAGQNVAGWKAGSGVFFWADGSRYEGAWANDKRDGFGVQWRADGTVWQAGRWEANNLVQALAK